MIPSVNFILKNYSQPENQPFQVPVMTRKSDGELVEVTYTVGYKFGFHGEEYGEYVSFLENEPSVEDIKSAFNILLDHAIESYEMLLIGSSSGIDKLSDTEMTQPIWEKVIDKKEDIPNGEQ